LRHLSSYQASQRYQKTTLLLPCAIYLATKQASGTKEPRMEESE